MRKQLSSFLPKQRSPCSTRRGAGPVPGAPTRWRSGCGERNWQGLVFQGTAAFAWL